MQAAVPCLLREGLRMTLRQGLVRHLKSNKVLMHWALKAYAIQHPPPFRAANMEFFAETWNGISSLHYRGGRMLGEDNAGPYPFREVTHNAYEACPFADTRLGLPMNVTNLTLVLPYAADAYRLTTVLRDAYRAQRGGTAPRFSLVQAYLFSRLAISLPAFLVRRSDGPIGDGQIEPLETAFYMLGTAPLILARQLMARGDRTVLHGEPLDGESLYALSSESRTLISNRECACPATPKLIATYFDVIMTGSYQAGLESAPVARVLQRIGDIERLFAYNAAASRLDLWLLLHKALTLKLLLALEPGAAADLAELAAGVERALLAPLSLSDADASAGPAVGERLQVIIDTLVALLQDQAAADTTAALAQLQLLETRALPVLARSQAAGLLRNDSLVIHRSCQAELQAVHAALRTRRWPPITVDDLVRRTAGPDAERALRQLIDSASNHGSTGA